MATINNANSTHDGLTFNTAEVVTIAPDGFVSNRDTGANAITAFGVGYTFNVNGLIQGFTNQGLSLDSPNFNNIKSKVNVGESGVIVGMGTGLFSSHLVDLVNNGVIQGGINAVQIDADGNYKITNAGRIETDSGDAIDLEGAIGTRTIVNTGTIISLSGNALNGDDAVENLTNSGLMIGDVNLGEGNNSLTNSGLITGRVFAGSGNDIVSNTASGVITDTVDLGDGVNSFTNAGFLNSDYDGGSGRDVVINKRTGVLNDDVNLGEGNNSFTNSGYVDEDVSAGSGNDVVTNNASGAIVGSVALGDGTNTLNNAGFIGGIVEGGSGVDTFTNTGTFDSDVFTFGGNDVVTNTGQMGGTFLLGEGNDRFTGGAFFDLVQDEGGDDNYALGGDDDTYIAIGMNSNVGTDTINGGGGGGDRYTLGLANSGLQINLDTIAHTDVNTATTVAANTAISADGGTDRITNFEDISGSDYDDFMFGNASANLVFGRDGDDVMYGFGGNDDLEGGFGEDRIYGGNGNDSLAGGDEDDTLDGGGGNDDLSGGTGDDIMDGGAGNDEMFGGSNDDTMSGGLGKDDIDGGGGEDIIAGGGGADILSGGFVDGDIDTLVYTALSDSTLAASGRDTIFDFEDGFDLIDIGALRTGGFTLIANDSVFSNTAGELRVQTIGSGWVISGDVDGNGTGDFGIEVFDTAHAIVWDSTDFILV